jgi:hypothetical protein
MDMITIVAAQSYTAQLLTTHFINGLPFRPGVSRE